MKCQTILCRYLMVITFAFAALSSTSSFAGVGAGGGGFVRLQAEKVLWKAKRQAAAYLKTVLDPEVNCKPEKRKIAVQAILNVRILPTEVRNRDGWDLEFDYDPASRQIFALKPFVDQYGALPDTQSDAAVNSVVSRLIHESAHLLGILDDEKAEEFSNRVQNAEASDWRGSEEAAALASRWCDNSVGSNSQQ